LCGGGAWLRTKQSGKNGPAEDLACACQPEARQRRGVYGGEPQHDAASVIAITQAANQVNVAAGAGSRPMRTREGRAQLGRYRAFPILLSGDDPIGGA
jgi:hypothetical protein